MKRLPTTECTYLPTLGKTGSKGCRVIKKGWGKLISRNHMLIPFPRSSEPTGLLLDSLVQKPQRKPNLIGPHVSPPLADL